ncbi:MAG TPA: hypothetical protein VEX62_08425, partial [Candidatus Limnocylindrales bacterium]|nr:hypothetical protein [Candidatus Limnocylindrales bacterium]
MQSASRRRRPIVSILSAVAATLILAVPVLADEVRIDGDGAAPFAAPNGQTMALGDVCLGVELTRTALVAPIA